MKVLLAKPVDKLGETGEIVEVARGYARNYLFPQKFAVEPTAHNVKRLEKPKLEREAELRNREEQAQALKQQLDGMTFAFQRTAQEGGKLYGSVRLEDIVSAIEKKTGHQLERDRVKLAGPIESLGQFTVPVTLYKEITTEIKVVVEEDNAPAAAKQEPVAAVEETPVATELENEAEGDAA